MEFATSEAMNKMYSTVNFAMNTVTAIFEGAQKKYIKDRSSQV